LRDSKGIAPLSVSYSSKIFSKNKKSPVFSRRLGINRKY